jgi:LmbE family N-acetylglucosaminyl deacetylase
MGKVSGGRKKFLLSSTMGLVALALEPVASLGKNKPEENEKNQLPAKLNILCVGAHPGDPEFGCGGTMSKYSDAGHTVTFLYLTRGEAYDVTQSHAWSAELRTKEAETSCKILNSRPVFAGQIDGNTELNKEQNEKITKLILSLNPDIVFTHWPMDSHMDHQVSAMLTLTAWLRSGRKFPLYFYEVNTGTETMAFTPTDYEDISGVRDRKKAAMFAHKTQAPEEIYQQFFKTLEEFRGLEAGVKAAEAFIRFKPEAGRARVEGL